MFNRVPDKFWNQGLTGSKIATSWFPMRLKIERWQPEFQGYFPYFAITSLWIQGISVELLSEHGRECKLYVPKIRAEWTLCRYKQNKNLIALPCPLLLFLQLLLNSQVEAWMNKNMKIVKHTYKNANFLSGGTLFQLSKVLTIDLMKLRSKDYYSLFLDKRKSQATGPMKRDHDFAPTALPWNQILIEWRLFAKRVNWENFTLTKLIYLIVATKKELTLYGITDNNKCCYSGEPDSVLHTCTFLNWSTTFFIVRCWTGSMRCITAQYHRQTTHYCLAWRVGRIITMLENWISLYYNVIVFANYYLHYHKVNERNLDWIEFTTKVNYNLRKENQISGFIWCFFAFFCPVNAFKRF